ncbi:hypothetical protein BU26DRAFT_599405 [Trematosphaeria pertusa]|uniref:Tat pathway signal sequence n=1 Tax=Trematosphaeria pertusa TaxID=390896 RepID=A0A6A6J282_9PLEO|nr:uncharacterized protein BU26DRAFT_599405 [Trematosphaeria pertusa]KAF2256776.1 hypothetical protein BU26DRAFT_599405 [Trematosphaeria pertusa]
MSHSKSEEAYSLLRDSSEDCPEDFPSNTTPSARRQLKLYILILINILLLLINLFCGSFLLEFHISSKSTSFSVHSPLNKIIQTQTSHWNLSLGDRTPFTEAPSRDVDALWDSISAPPGNVGTIIVQKEDLEKSSLESIELADGSGYLATVDVFHQLHCLDFIRKYVFNATYQLSPAEHPLWEDHIAHCIDSIRLSLQCSSDVSLITWKWVEGYGNPWPDFRSKHECRNWDDILGWASERRFDPNTPGSFVHPELGPVDGLEGKWFQNPLEGGKPLRYVGQN